MTQTEILKEIKKLTTAERLTFIEATLHFIREDLQIHHKLDQQPTSLIERKKNLQAAAKILLSDYLTDDELTIFTTLNGENFHA